MMMMMLRMVIIMIMMVIMTDDDDHNNDDGVRHSIDSDDGQDNCSCRMLSSTSSISDEFFQGLV